jgi:flagellar hook protein FlgE
MSLLGALNTAISGLTGQSAAFGNIGDNIANSQTTGFKRVDTNFIDYLTTSSPTNNEPGAVVAVPDYVNNVEGTVTQSDNPLALAISGQGFFAVSQSTSAPGAPPYFSTQPYYTRDGDFQMNSNGYLVNDAGEYLNGWLATSTGALDKTNIAPIQVSQSAYKPVATANVSMAANLPPAGNPDTTTPTQQDPVSSTIDVYDAEGTAHQLTLSYTLTPAANGAPAYWNLAVTDDANPPNEIAQAYLQFNADGTLAQVTPAATPFSAGPPPSPLTPASPPTSLTPATAGTEATLALATTYPTVSGAFQNINLKLGSFGGTDGVTQFAATSYTLGGLSQDGVPPGNFGSVSMTTAGGVVVNYSNGQSRTVAQVPVMTFTAPDALQSQNGASFTATLASGSVLANTANSNGAGALVTSSVEGSNVDLASEFSQLIVAQQAYSANAKVVTTASQMIQNTLDMKQ